MKSKNVRVCILRIEGTNCEEESYKAFHRLLAKPELVHLKQLSGDVREAAERRRLSDYQCLMIPGGFSSGDYIRAGAIFAARIKSALKDDLSSFVAEGYPVLGVCNGFQILVELGLLPSFNNTITRYPQAVLTVNDSAKFECRPTLLKHENTCVFTSRIPKERILTMPCAHAEGKFLFAKEKEEEYLKRLIENGQIVFRYVDQNGDYCGYPWNPNGSIYNIAGICNLSRNVFGIMPHPERAFYNYTNYTGAKSESESDFIGDGRIVFESVMDYISRKF